MQDKKLLVNELEARVVREAFDLFLMHRQQAIVARLLNERMLVPRGTKRTRQLAWSKEAIGRILKGAVYAGFITYGEEVHPGEHPPIIERGHPAGVKRDKPVPALRDWLHQRVVELGVESNDDLQLLSGSDFLAPELPFEARGAIDGDYPLDVNVGDARYRVEYALEHNQVALHLVKGSRTDPPPLGYLPKFPGLRIQVDGPKGVSVVRARG